MSWRETYKEHLSPTGQLKRSVSPELKTEVFIARAREVHGDKYDYSKVKYLGAHDQVSIICHSHGEFLQSANSHLKGRGCPSCAGNVKKTAEEFIFQARRVHGNKFDYSNVEYRGRETKVEVICREHGGFFQAPKDHLRGQGCPSCYGNKKSSTEDFIGKATALHGTTYNYDKVEYTSSHVKVSIICPEHGNFEQTPANHLSGMGCPKCAVSNQNTIYLIEYLSAGTRVGTKVGITNNFDQRLSKLRSASPYDVAPIQYWIVDNPRAIESAVLKQFTKVGNLGASFDGSTEILEEPTEQIAQFIEELVYVSI